MSMRFPSGFNRPGYDPLKNPNAPTGVSATGGDASASVAFTPPSNEGGSAVSAYYAVANDGTTATGSSSPVNVTGLTNGTSYTFQVWALNTYGPGVWSAASGSVTPVATVGVFAGDGATYTNTIQYISIATTGNATDWGDLTSYAYKLAACASSTRGIFAGGAYPTHNIIQYITFATTGNAATFGTLTTQRNSFAGCNSDTRGIFAGGALEAGGRTNVIDYITIGTTGNTSDFGDLSVGLEQLCGSSSNTRGLFAGGTDGTARNYMSYVTIATLGNAVSFGSLSLPTQQLAACSSSTRSIISGGKVLDGTYYVTNVIGYATIATTGSYADFGDLATTLHIHASTSSAVRGVFAGGSITSSPSAVNIISYVTISSLGNASDFGDLVVSTLDAAGCSNGNGGL